MSDRITGGGDAIPLHLQQQAAAQFTGRRHAICACVDQQRPVTMMRPSQLIADIKSYGYERQHVELRVALA